MAKRHQFEEDPPLKSLLADLSRDELLGLLTKLAEQQPPLLEALAKELAVLRPAVSKATLSVQHAPVDTKAIRRKVHSVLHSLDRMRSSEAYGYVRSVVGEVVQIARQALERLDTGDGRGALALLEALTEEYVAEWTNLDDSDGYAGESFSDLGTLWAEALLSTELTLAERKRWADQLTIWQKELDDYGVGEAFDPPATAILHGWDYPPLQRVLQGIITDQGAWADEAPAYADDLAEIRLRILARQGRFQEYLYLAEAEGQTEAYVTMLVRLDRAQEALEYGLKYLHTPLEALALAQALYEHGERAQSLQLAEYGLTLEGVKAEVAKWLRDHAEVMERYELALSAAEQAFRAEISLDNYHSVARLAGEHWPERQVSLLEYARTTTSFSQYGRVAVFLHEGLIDDAIAALEPHAGHELVGQVVDAALTSRPAWVIEACRKQADPIMNRGKSQYYSAAANWLTKVRSAYLATGRAAEWQTYLSELLTRHARKHSLVPLLKRLQ